LLLKGKISLAEALVEDDNILHRLHLVHKRTDFVLNLLNSNRQIEAVVASHLAVSPAICTIDKDIKNWIHGSFNVCVPILIDKSGVYPARKVLIRFPLPHKLGEDQYPGNAEEKLRCEVAAYNGCKNIAQPFQFLAFMDLAFRKVQVYSSHLQALLKILIADLNK
jgi:hypothetical protein